VPGNSRKNVEGIENSIGGGERKDSAEEKREADGDGGQTGCVARRKQHPAVHERGKAPIDFPEVDILSPSLGEHCTQLCKRKTTEEGNHTGCGPKDDG
jgi:hypothetical protein